MSDRPVRLHRLLLNQLGAETIMTSGSLLYLLMCLATFGVFSAVLAYESWQQSRLGRETVPAEAPHEADPVMA
jgi:hypothetical protein